MMASGRIASTEHNKLVIRLWKGVVVLRDELANGRRNVR